MLERKWGPPRKVTFLVSGLIEIAGLALLPINPVFAYILAAGGWIILAIGVTRGGV